MKDFMKKSVLYKNFNYIIDMLAILSFVGMFLAVLLQIFFRFFLNISILGLTEIALFLVVWTTFLGSAVAIREEEHLKVDLLENYISKKYKKFYHAGVGLLMGGWLFILLYGAIKRFIKGRGIMISGLKLSVSFLYLAVIIGALLMIIYLIISRWRK